MKLSAAALATITPTASPRWPDQGVDRPGGPDAPAPANAVAQVRMMFPMNFGASVLQDVRLGARLATHATLEEATNSARDLAHGRTSVGIVREQVSYAVAELLVYDNDTMGIDPAVHRDTPLLFGQDPARTRIMQSVHLLEDPGARPVLEGLWTRGGNTYIGFDANGDGTVTFNHA